MFVLSQICALCILIINEAIHSIHIFASYHPPKTLSYSAALKMFLATYCFSSCFILLVLFHCSLVIKRSPDVIDSFCHMPFDLPHLIIARPTSADLDRKDVFLHIFPFSIFIKCTVCNSTCIPPH